MQLATAYKIGEAEDNAASTAALQRTSIPSLVRVLKPQPGFSEQHLETNMKSIEPVNS